MRIHRLGVTDFIAGMLVAGATTVYAAGLAGADFPGLGGVRARACVVFFFGALACVAGARRDVFEGTASRTAAAAFLDAVGVLTLLAGLMRHLMTVPSAPAVVTPDRRERELVKR